MVRIDPVLISGEGLGVTLQQLNPGSMIKPPTQKRVKLEVKHHKPYFPQKCLKQLILHVNRHLIMNFRSSQAHQESGQSVVKRQAK